MSPLLYWPSWYKFTIGEIISLLVSKQFFNPLLLISFGILGILKLSTYIIFICIIVVVIASFIAPFSSHPALMLVRQLMEPLTRPIQRIIPPMGGLDFSVLFLGMGVVIVQKLLDATAMSIGLRPLLVVGY